MNRAAQQLRQACHVLSDFLSLLRMADHGCAQVTPADLARTFAEIARVGEILRLCPTSALDPELEDAFRLYRGLLERLRQEMPLLQGRLLTERARLEAQRAHLEAATLWADASRYTR